MTVRLYYTEPWRRDFDAQVVSVEPEPSTGRLRVRLTRSAFYPTSGGQPHDTGTLDAGTRVVDVVDDEDAGEMVHVVDGRLEVGARVAGVIDWARRFDHMQQHSGQHVLSAAFVRTADVATVSFHLGEELSTIDLAREVTADEIAGAERAANEVIWDNRPVTIRFVSDEEAAKLPLRKPPVRTGQLRLIEVRDWDLSACGGTHVSRTGQIGLIAVRQVERVRGSTRVSFLCGGRVLDGFRTLRAIADRTSAGLSVSPADLPAAVERLQGEIRTNRAALRDASERLAVYDAEGLAADAERIGRVAVIAAAPDGYDVAGLKALAGAIAKSDGRVAVLFTTASPAQVVAVRSADVAAVDASQIVRGLAGRFGGKGGGKADLAQGGGLVGTPADLLEAARAAIRQMLQ